MLPDPVRGDGNDLTPRQIARLSDVIDRLADELEAATTKPIPAAATVHHPRDRPRHRAKRCRICTGSRHLTAGATSPPGLAWSPGKGRLAARPGWARSARWAKPHIRRLLIVGAMSVIRWVVRKGGSANRWLATLVIRKPKMVAAVALANKMARMIWRLQQKSRITEWRDPNPRRETVPTWPKGRGERSTRSRRHGLRSSRQEDSVLGPERLQLSEPM